MKQVFCIIIVLSLLASPFICSKSEDSVPNDRTFHLEQYPAPPFSAPDESTPRILEGNLRISTSKGPAHLEWRLLSPNLSLYNPGDFWTSFDLKSNVSDGFDTVIVEFRDPTELSLPSGI